MKRWKKILALTFTLSLISPSNIFAEEIQLTDYRYENCMYGLYGYNFCNIFTGKIASNNVYGESNYVYYKDNTGDDRIIYDSVILNPDGTELFQQGKYETAYSWTSLIPGIEGVDFPQYEHFFIVQDKTTDDSYLLDQFNNVLATVTKNWDSHSLGIMDILEINNEEYILLGSTVFEGANLESGIYCPGNVRALVRTRDGKVIFNLMVNPRWEASTLYISTDENYLMTFSASLNYNGYDYSREYYDLEGNVIDEPEGVTFNQYINTGEYLQINSDYIVTTDKVNRNYTFKEKVIGGKSYYALFKELEEGETAADYIPEEQPSFWAVDTIRQATEAGLLYNNSNCRYQANISRQDFAVLAVEAYCKSLGMNVDEYVSKNNITLDFDKFEDTQNAYVLLSNELGILSGTSDTTFSPDRGITRQEAAVMLNNMAKLSGLSPNSEQVDFVDDSYFATWAEDAITSISSIKNDDLIGYFFS